MGLAALVVFAGVLESESAVLAAGKSAGIDDGLFTNDSVLELQLEIPAKGMAALRRYEWSRQADPADRVSVPATVREGAAVYTNVAVHLKGAAGSFQPLDGKPGVRRSLPEAKTTIN